MEQVVPRVKEFEGKPALFLSLSVDRWDHGDPADTQFLNEWKTKYGIPFPVLGSSPAELREIFSEQCGIPAALVLDKDDKITLMTYSSDLDQLLGEVRRLMNGSR